MMDVKQIVFCPDNGCETCSLTAKIMDVLGDTADLGSDVVVADRVVALAHATARTLYGHYRARGDLDETDLQASGINFFAELVASTLVRIREHDPVTQ